VAGSAIVDSLEPGAGTSVTLIYKSWNVHQAQKGLYRIDCEPPRLRAIEGEVEVSTASGGAAVSAGQGMYLPFAAVLAPEKFRGESHDALTDWADGRAQSVSADNAIAANIQDPASMVGSDFPPDTFTYFPMLGLSSFGSSLSSVYGSFNSYQSGVYGPLSPYQSGFYSIYLPGYTRRPLFWLPPGGLQRPFIRRLESVFPGPRFSVVLSRAR